MANELNIRLASGLNIYAQRVRDSDQFVWNGSAYEDPVAANWSTYTIAMTEKSTTGYYVGTDPDPTTIGSIVVFQRAGGSAATTDTVVGGDPRQVTANVTRFAGTSFTDTSGRVAAAFSTFFNIVSPVSTMNAVGIDWAHVANPTTTVNLVGTTISTNQEILNILGDVEGSVLGSIAGSVAGNVQGRILGGGGGVISGVGVWAKDGAGAAIATASAVSNIANNTFIGTNVPPLLERPDSGSVTVQIVAIFNDDTGAAVDIDAAATPTVTLVNNAGTDLSSRLSAWAHPATGKYTANYTNTVTDAVDNLHWDISGTVNAKLRRWVGMTQIVDTTAVSFTSSDRTTLLAAATATALASVQADTDNLQTRLPTALDSDGFIKANIKSIGDVPGFVDYLKNICGDYYDGAWLATVEGVNGDIVGKVLGGGVSTITGAGVWSFDSTGATIATNAQATAIAAKTTNLPSDPAGLAGLASAHGAGSWATATGFAIPGSAMTLTTGERNSIAMALLTLADGIEVNVTMKQALQDIAAALAGDVTAGGSVYKAIGNTGTTRLTVTEPATGERTVTRS